MTAGVPPRVEAGTKAALLDFVDGAVGEGWTTARACSVLELDSRRCRRWQHRRGAGRLDDNTAGGAASHAITPFERRAILELFERWGDIDGGYRKLAHRGSYENLVWVSPSTLYRVLAAQGLVLPARAPRAPAPARPLPDWIEWKRHQIWIYDITHFPRAGRVAYAILDVVTRKWLATLVTAEETATQVEVVFTQALDTEGLWPVVEARQAERARHGDDGSDGSRSCWQCQTTDPKCEQAPPGSSWPSAASRRASAGPAPRRTKHGSRPCSATSKPNGPTSRRSPTPTRCEQSSTSPETTTTPAACTPPSATSPPTTNTRAEATPSARPAKTASPGPASPASPTIATTNPTSHEHTRPMRRNQTPENGHLLRSTSGSHSTGILPIRLSKQRRFWGIPRVQPRTLTAPTAPSFPKSRQSVIALTPVLEVRSAPATRHYSGGCVVLVLDQVAAEGHRRGVIHTTPGTGTHPLVSSIRISSRPTQPFHRTGSSQTWHAFPLDAAPDSR